MGKRGRRTVLQLNDNKESFLARYGYLRNEEDNDSRGSEDNADESDGDQEDKNDNAVSGGKAHIDHQVADFLAEIDALHTEKEDENEEEPVSSVSVEIPPPSFQLNADPRSVDVPQSQSKSVSKPKPSYNMFVKGESEFTRKQDHAVTQSIESEDWPEEPKTVWQQTLDDNTQCYYYWNTVTNAVTWEIPAEYTQYLLLKKEYDAKVEKLTKEGKKKPVKPKTVSAQSTTAQVKSNVGPQQPEESTEASTIHQVTSSSSIASSVGGGKCVVEESKPDSTVQSQKPSKPVLVAATYYDTDEEDSNSDSEYVSDEDKNVKDVKSSKEDVPEAEIDIDDIDKALDFALEKKKPSDEDESSGKGSGSGKKHRSLIDEMKKQVQRKLESEMRKKAAIEELMAKENERRFGSFRKRSPDGDISSWESKRSRTDDKYSRRSRSRDRHSSHRSSCDQDHERESKRKHDDRKDKKKKDDRKSREKEERSERKKEREERRKERHKDKHRDKDEKKRDKDKKDRKDSDRKKEEKREKQDNIEDNSKKDNSPERIEEEPPVKVPVPVVKPEDRAKEVQLANLKMQASELADLALSKLEFLEVTKKGLSRLQILLIELETRHGDWTAGGLNTEYFVSRLEEANWQLQQYEQSAAPMGWTCHWDRAYRRYFYMNKRTKKTQWDYPDDDEEEVEEGEAEPEEDVDTTEPKCPAEKPSGVEHTPPRLANTCDTSAPPVAPSLQEPIDKDVVSSSEVSQSVPDTTVHKSQVSSSSGVASTAKSKTCDTDTSTAGISAKSQLPPPPPEQHPSSSVVSASFPPSSQAEYPTPPYSGAYSSYGTQDAGSMYQGEPPPPGTDLECLLSAPPPPPPPPEEESEVKVNGVNSSDHQNTDMEVDDTASITSQIITNEPYERNDVYPKSAVSSSSTISKAPQMIVDSSYTEPSSVGSSLPVEMETGANSAPSSIVTSSAAGEPSEQATLGDTASSSTSLAGEKKKKKKDKTLGSSSLKKKNVSSLVQRWQKVKKEVEIEERHREEREMAIRQQLEEWKQEHG